MVIVFNAAFNNISVISWRSVLLVEETGVSGKKHRPAQVTCKLDHIMLYRVHLAWVGFEFTTLVMIGTDCIGSYKSNYHTITSHVHDGPYWFCVKENGDQYNRNIFNCIRRKNMVFINTFIQFEQFIRSEASGRPWWKKQWRHLHFLKLQMCSFKRIYIHTLNYLKYLLL